MLWYFVACWLTSQLKYVFMIWNNLYAFSRQLTIFMICAFCSLFLWHPVTFLPTQKCFTRPNDGWTGLYIKSWTHLSLAVLLVCEISYVCFCPNFNKEFIIILNMYRGMVKNKYGQWGVGLLPNIKWWPMCQRRQMKKLETRLIIHRSWDCVSVCSCLIARVLLLD